jgi:hypothetical protein
MEAIEEEMGDDEVEWRLWKLRQIALKRVCVHQPHIYARGQPSRSLLEHFIAGIHCDDVDGRAIFHKSSQKSTIAITIDQSTPGGRHFS